jgi:hypothetical protein
LDKFKLVRIGLVGYGNGGRFYHAPLIVAAAGCELAGVVTRSAERRGELERDHPGTSAYDDLTHLASAGMDAVAISTPADTHVPLVLEAISSAPFSARTPARPERSATRPAWDRYWPGLLAEVDDALMGSSTVPVQDGAWRGRGVARGRGGSRVAVGVQAGRRCWGWCCR